VKVTRKSVSSELRSPSYRLVNNSNGEFASRTCGDALEASEVNSSIQNPGETRGSPHPSFAIRTDLVFASSQAIEADGILHGYGNHAVP
jgi:hypothetical protein